MQQHKYCNAQLFSREKWNIFQMGYFFIQTAFHFAGDSAFSLLVQLWFPSKRNALGNNLLQQIPFINKPKLCLKEHQDSCQKRWDLFTKRTRRCKWMRQEQWEKEAWCLKVNVQCNKTVRFRGKVRGIWNMRNYIQ